MYDKQHITHDSAIVEFDDDAEGITVDEDGNAEFDWDEIETTTVENPPHANAFDSKEFYKIPATVAKPIPQPYQYGEDTVWLKKPREELKKAAWSLDNAPWTMGHPDSGMVKDVDSVRGFWKNPRYIDGLDDLDADLHIPVNDDEAKEYVEGHDAVSVGFYNRIARTDEYDGVVGGEDDDGVEVEGYQTSMLFDHCASVSVGRCPTEAGCGIDSFGGHGHVNVVDEDPFKRGARIMDKSDAVDGTSSTMKETTDQPSGIFTADDTWFAVGPDEHTKESTDHPEDAMFPVDSCSDVEDAWNLRDHAEDLSIEQSTLESRIQRAGDAMDCSGMPWMNEDSRPTMDDVAESASRYSISGRCKDCDDDTHDTNMEIDFDDLSTEAALAKLESQHDGASERLEELRDAEEHAEVAQDAAEELGLDEIGDLVDKVGLLEDRRDELEKQLDEVRRPQMEEDAEFIAEHTERFGEDAEAVIEELDEDAEQVSDKRELVEELVDGYDEQTANSGDEGSETRSTVDGKYVKTPW